MPDVIKFAPLCLLMLLTACGNKGPLYLPDAEPVMQAPPAPAANHGNGAVQTGPEQ